MITCCIRRYSRMWLEIIPRLGGVHHGYFLPSEGAIDIARALFSFPSFADFERYRGMLDSDPEARAALDFAQETRCFLRYDRTFFRPLLTACGSATPVSTRDKELS